MRTRERSGMEEVFQAILESDGDVAMLALPEGLKYITPNCLALTGYSQEEFLAEKCLFEKLIVEEDLVLWEHHKHMIESQSAHVPFKLRIRTKPGEVKWVNHQCRPVFASDGTFMGQCGSFRDVTELVHLEYRLNEEKEFAENLILNSTVPIYVLNNQHIIILWNRACEELTGMAAVDMVGTTNQWQPFYPQQRPTMADLLIDGTLSALPELYANYRQSLYAPDGIRGENWFAAMNGCDRYILFEAAPVRNAQGTITAVVETLQDITQQKQAEEQLKATHQQLLQQEKMASIGQLAAGVAHEINNPMGFIASNLGTLRKYLDRCMGYIQYQEEQMAACSPERSAQSTAKRKEMKIDRILEDVPQLIDESLDGAERVKQIVADLKSFSRVDEAEESFADLNQCLESTINMIWNELKYKATLNRQYGEIPQVKCHPQQLNQVFMNLLVNGAHAIEKQGELTVKSWCDQENVYVAISDTGCGIPEEIRSRIFEPFFTTKEVGKGTGLGLSISYEIVKKHDGDISVESTVGTGTTFTIRIPIVADNELKETIC